MLISQKAENSKDVQLGALIALMVEEGDDWKNVTVPDDVDTPSTAPSRQDDSPVGTSVIHTST